MGKLLRVLAVFFLLLSGVALWLGIYLFGKREILKGRTQKLENTVITMGTFIESEETEPQTGTFKAKDTADCTSELTETPTVSEFWSSYALHLEQQEHPTMDIGSRKTELMSYYKINPIDLKVERDAQGYKVTEGKTTMQNLLNEVTEKTKNQLNRLNQTRRQLKVVREELESTIDELNQRKAALRQGLNEIVQLKQKIRQLEEEIVGLQKKISDLEAEKAALQDRIAEMEQTIKKLEDRIKEKDDDIVSLKKEIKALKELKPTITPGAIFSGKIEPGEKGRVISVNKESNFAVIELSAQFLQEITMENGGFARGVNLMVKRPDKAGTFVTKVAVMQVKRGEKMAIADILLDWQQLPVQKGDILFY